VSLRIIFYYKTNFIPKFTVGKRKRGKKLLPIGTR
jgi:hypothetical protein